MDCHFIVTRSPNQKYGIKNVFVHSKNRFEDIKYFKLDNTIYKSMPISMNDNEIGINGIVRMDKSIEIGDMIDIEIHDAMKQYLDILHIQISFQITKKELISIDENYLISKIMNYFKNYYFCNGQVLIFLIKPNNLFKNKICLILRINTEKELCGFINENTKFIFTTDELTLNIKSSKMLDKNLFKKNFDFAELGIGGLNEQLKDILKRALSTRAVNSTIIEKLGIKHVKGIIFYGPPGTGKTLIARNIGKLLSDQSPKIINGPEILNKYVGESEKNIRDLFLDAEKDELENGNNSSLHIIIFDEIDAICRKRSGNNDTRSSTGDSIVNQLLSKIDGINSLNNIFIIAMTNRFDLIDPALLRPGRLEIHIKIGLPDFEGRKEIFKIHTKKMKGNNMLSKNVDFDLLSNNTQNFSGAEIEAVVKNASNIALYEKLSNDVNADNVKVRSINYENGNNNNNLNNNNSEIENIVISKEHFEIAIKKITPAFGNSLNRINKIIPTNIIESNNGKYEEILNFLTSSSKFKKLLVSGNIGTGKTMVLGYFAKKLNIGFTKLITCADILGMDERQKINLLSTIINDAHITEESLIILDDVDILIDYLELGNNITFSNRTYQTLITILKMHSINNSITIMCSSSSKLANLLDNFFDKHLDLNLNLNFKTENLFI